MLRRRRSALLGFSLLEVLFAVTLFGAVVTFILSAQAGLIAGNRTAADMTHATELARCRMSELEEKELRLGYPEVEEKDTSTECCESKETPGFSCDWTIERVKLPEVTALGGDAGLNSVLGGSLGLSGGSGLGIPGAGAGGLDPAAAAAAAAAAAGGLSGSLPSPAGSVLSNPFSSTLDLDAGIHGLGTSLDQTFGGAGAQGLLSMVFSIVYPSLKPLLEAAIRKVTVTIHWKEGIHDRDLSVIQYITNPSRAGLAASMADAGVFNADGGTSKSSSSSPLNSLGGGLGGLGGLGAGLH